MENASFGFSVSAFNDGENPTVFIGAPTNEDVGAVMKCDFHNENCEDISEEYLVRKAGDVDHKGNLILNGNTGDNLK